MRTVMVTGASRNIGFEVASSFAGLGDAVVLNSRDAEAVESAAERIRSTGGQAVAVPGDISDPGVAQRSADEAGQRFGSVDVLVHCATARALGPFLELSREQWSAPWRVVVDGAANCAWAVLPAMLAAGWGRLVFITGLSGHSGGSGRAGLIAAKSGLTGLTKALASEYADSGVTVNAVSPGHIETVQVERQEGAAPPHDREIPPVGRKGTVGEVSQACHYLASTEAAFVTGHTLHVNGGQLMP